MSKFNILKEKFSEIYFLYIQKAERKNRTKEEVDTIICWLTGYTENELSKQIEDQVDVETFYNHVPNLNINSNKIKGLVCGIRVEDITDPLMKKIRLLDKLIDELAKGKKMDEILRS